jgi:membrane protease YdiL (CAAX protease family)
VLLLGVGGGVPAVLLSSAAHSAWHFQWYRTRFISYARAFGFALLFGVITLLTGSLWPAIAMHGLGDFFGNADRA